mmetsp:Transcript_43686/g.70994  ORF Transcript_43686/g.70994 Transcript_43686/m.70994 type:complete len:282 (+) Transcript_43686:59-904(+)
MASIIPAGGEDASGKPRILSCKILGDPVKFNSEVFCGRFALDGQFVATGCGDGVVRVYNPETGKLVYTLIPDQASNLPITCVRFRPFTAASKTRNVLLAAGADGVLRHWHITSGKCLNQITETDNQVYAIDYRSDGLKFLSAGLDYKVRLYDEATKTLIQTMAGGYGKSRPGHSNRVYSLKFVPGSENLFLSGGWDNTIQVWDSRVETSVRNIFGPHICGDSIDIYDNLVLTGSWRPKDQLQTWDLNSCELIQTYKWPAIASQQACMVYAAQFSGGKIIIL